VGFLGVQAEGEVVDDDLADVGAQDFGVAHGGERVVAGDEDVGLVGVLQFEELLDGAHVVAQVQLAGGLEAGEESWHGRGGLRVLSGVGAIRVAVAGGDLAEITESTETRRPRRAAGPGVDHTGRFMAHPLDHGAPSKGR